MRRREALGAIAFAPLLLAGLAPVPGLFMARYVRAQQGVPAESPIDNELQNMTLERKLGQLIVVEFTGPTLSSEIATMVGSQHAGGVILYARNGNIDSAAQLRGLIAQMQSVNGHRLLIAIDQEGGYVDRLASLDGERPSAASIGDSADETRAMAAGSQDADDLAGYGINLNLAPVVDIGTASNPQLIGRTYGSDPQLVTYMAGSYLRGLQRSRKVFGTLKHFPGLGGVSADPHEEVAKLQRSKLELEAIDWQPYRTLIARGDVHAIMTTHELVPAVDPVMPSTLSRPLITDVLRRKMHFNGVIITDSLSMKGITAFYPPSQSAALAIGAGSDLLTGADSPRQVSAMITGIRQAIEAGTIGISRVDESVRRVLRMKAALGLTGSTEPQHKTQ
jgi:beta-N-acetylhexosaminidase